MCAEVLLPRKWLDSACLQELEDRIIFFFLFTCSCANFLFCFSKLPFLHFQVVFHLIFSFLSPVQREGGVIERLCGYLASSQGEPTTNSFDAVQVGQEKSQRTLREI